MPQDDPCAGQTEQAIGAYLASRDVGDFVAMRNTQGVGMRLMITTITEISRDRGRIYTADKAERGGKAWYIVSGRNCYNPKGQSRLVIPTDRVVEFARRFGKVGAVVKV